MARTKDKLEALARPIRPLKVLSRDGEREVEVLYQRPTVFQDRILRETMKLEFDQAVAAFEDESKGESRKARILKEFLQLGRKKTISFIVASDLEAPKVDALKMMSRGPLDPDASEDAKKEWMEEFRPLFDDAIKAHEDAYEGVEDEVIYETAADNQINKEARERAFEMYRKRLILDSLFEVDEEDNSKVVAVFDDIEEIEKLLSPEVMIDIAAMIAEELRKAREVPLKSVSTT